MKTMNTNIWTDYMDRWEKAEYEAMLDSKYGKKIKEEETVKEDKEKVTTNKKEEA